MSSAMSSPRKAASKRIGGAPFSSPVQRKRDSYAFSSPRDAGDGASAIGGAMSSLPRCRGGGGGARRPVGVRCLAATGSGAKALGPVTGRCRSSDPPRSQGSTPCTERAARYVDSLLGERRGADGGAVPGTSGAMTAREGAAREWTLMVEMDQVEHFKKERDRRNFDRQKRHDNLAHLRAQKEEQEQAKEECRNLWRRWRDEVEDDVDRWRQEQEQKRLASLEVRRQFNEGCRLQLEEAKRKRRAAREAEDHEARELTAAASAATRAVQVREETAKKQGRAEAFKMMEEAKEAQRRKHEERRKDAEFDKACARQQRDIMDQQQRAREAERQERLDRQEKMVAAYAVGVGNELEKKQREDEERALRHQQRLEEKQQRQEHERQLRIQSMREAGQRAVAEQLQRQALDRQQRHDEEVQLAEQMRQATVAAEAREKDKQRRRLEARMANAEDLRRQIQERSAQIPPHLSRDQMNEVERALNRQRLQEVQAEDAYTLMVRKKRGEYRLIQKSGH